MFNFLKKKLKKTIDVFSKKVEDESKEVTVEPTNITNLDETKEKNKDKIVEEKNNNYEKNKKSTPVNNPSETKQENETTCSTNIQNNDDNHSSDSKPNLKSYEPNETVKNKAEVNISSNIKKESFFQRLVSKKLDESKFEDLFWDLEIVLLENNISVEVIDKIKDDLKKELVNQSFKKKEILSIITSSLEASLKEVLDFEPFDLLKEIKQADKPYVICFFGINGSGKTTTIAKLGAYLKKNNLSVVFGAADTFRAAAIHQIEEHGVNLNIKVIKHDYGSDPAAVAFDTIKHAESKNIDVVLIDTAGRLHSNSNLLEEMKKIIRIAKPNLKIFVGESITGNDCVEQAKKFNELIGIDGIILSKADIDEKGGAAISIGYVTGKPILFIGTGQNYEDIEQFNSDEILKKINL